MAGQAAASMLGTLFGGVIVDRIGGRRTAIVSDALSLVTVLALVVALFADFVPPWLIVTQVLGCCSTGRGWWPGTRWCPGWPGRTTSPVRASGAGYRTAEVMLGGWFLAR